MEILATLSGVLIRVGVPLGLTVFAGWLLYKLDKRWLTQEGQKDASAGSLVHNIGCWSINGCSPENRAKCRAYQQQDIPCWQVFRLTDGYLKENCLNCKVFQEAPMPVKA